VAQLSKGKTRIVADGQQAFNAEGGSQMARGRGLWFASCAATLVAVAMPADAAAPAAGDATAGKALFSGARRAQNGGAPCGACHAVGGQGPAFAASLGPDLSHSFDGLPLDAIDGMLQDLPFPTMAPLYAGRALTPVERADLAAFLVAGAGAPPPHGREIAGYAIAVAAACLVGMTFAARRRKGSTRAQLRAHPPAPEAPPLVPRPPRSEPVAERARSVAARGGAR
jgi:mono/diheme cytochrome c family protein